MAGTLSPVNDDCCVFQAVEVCTSGGGSMVIGDPVVGGINTTVLYVDSAGNLAGSTAFTFVAAEASYVQVNGAVVLGAGSTNVSLLGEVNLRNNAGVFEISQNGGAYAPVGGLAIGQAISGSTANALLYVSGASTLANNAGLTFDGSGTLTLSGLSFTNALPGGAASFAVDGTLAIGIGITSGNITAYTASTENIGFYVAPAATKEWATGAITTQRENVFLAPTYSFVGASTITVASTLSVAGPPAAGTNATITEARSLDVDPDAAGTSMSVIGQTAIAGSTGDTSRLAVYDNRSSATAFGLKMELATTTLNASTTVDISIGNTVLWAMTSGLATLSFENATTNTTLDMFDTRRTTSGTAAANLGAGHTMTLEDAGGTQFTASRYATIVQTATAGTPSSQVDIYTVAAGTLALQASFGSSGRGFYVPSTSRIAFGTPAANGALMISSNICTFTMGTIAFGYSFTTGISSSGARKLMTFTAAAHTAQTAGTEINNFDINLSATKQWATGAITTQREIRVQAPTYAFVGASTITDAATFYIDNAPQQGTNATITNAYALWIDAGRIRIDQGVALGGGAAPTLGTIGGSGPATAAQNQWLEVTIDGIRNWVPCWQ